MTTCTINKTSDACIDYTCANGVNALSTLTATNCSNYITNCTYYPSGSTCETPRT